MIELPETEPLAIEGVRATPLQRKRYIAVLRATVSEIERVGLPQVGMRDISRVSRVAVATIYRYFGSRDRLFYLATDMWLNQIVVSPPERDSATPIAKRMISMFTGTSAIQREHHRMLEGWALSNLSPDPAVAELIKDLHLVRVRDSYPFVEEDDESLINDLTTIVEAMWFAGVTRWAHGQKSLPQVWRDTARGMQLTLIAHGKQEWSSPDLHFADSLESEPAQAGSERR